MRNPAPNVSVLMTTYRNDPGIVCRATASILNQTYRDIELILVFEPGDSAILTVKKNFPDPRLIVVENAQRLGRSRSYNVGLRMARGRYLARMDADDYSYPHRLVRQIAFLQAHPDIAVIGANVRLIDSDGNPAGVRAFPIEHAGIMHATTFINPMCHPTVVWDRRQIGYDVQFDLNFSRFCDDLELWMRLMARGHKFANLPEVLLDYQQINAHRRPRENWKLNFAVRKMYWRLGLKHPNLLIGLAAFGILTLLPDAIIDRLTQRGKLSDKLRYLRPSA